MTTVISARHLFKRFTLGRETRKLRNLFDRATRASLGRMRNGNGHMRQLDDHYWALNDVSFEVAEGETVALMGHNGAGKSVLLRVLARVTRPTRGEADLYGSVGAVLDVGVGFNRELNGRENIFLQGAILGIKKRDLAKKYDAIVELSGMQNYLELPLKTYSSGMQVRLAFAVAAQLEPSILLMDEVLAVADEDFLRICIQRLNELKREGRTILLASHDVTLLSKVCDRAIWMEQGRIAGDGPIAEIAEKYHASALNPSGIEPRRHRFA
jgi:lipopolysaccharide transport system ATP-binding protein